MELDKALETRYSCRSFQATPPAAEQLQAILEAGRLAPSAKNNQPVHIWVAQGTTLETIDQYTSCRYNAPVVLVIGYDTTQVAQYQWGSPTENRDFGDTDVAIVITHLMLKTTELGLASCWIGAVDTAGLAKALGLPDTIQLRALLDLGTPADGRAGAPSPRHTSRKPLEETVTWL